MTGAGDHARALLRAAALAALLATPATLAGQDSTRATVDSTPAPSGHRMAAPIFVGTDAEDRLRTLQLLGAVPLYPWSVRGFSIGELDRLRAGLGEHPWRALPEFRRTPHDGALRWAIVPPQLDLWYNTTYPFGFNDGAVWRGRGATVAAEGGLAVAWRGVSLTLAPTAFWAENRSFPFLSNGAPDGSRFNDPRGGVDLPQRFGDRAYTRLDPGQSTLRVDLFGISAGASTANEWWGPMAVFPYILGNNAPGFPHIFVGSSRPWNVGIGRVHTRVLYGRLDQSPYTAIPDSAARRFAAGWSGVFMPRGVPGLELGGARFYHTIWPNGGPTADDFRRPFQALLKSSFWGKPVRSDDIGGDYANQLASLFFRWVLPRGGVEVYGEFGREDHSTTAFELIQEPDHSATYGLGFAKAARVTDGALTVRGELMNYRVSTLIHHRMQGGIYVHSDVMQGHTQRGQLLGAPIGVRSGVGSLLSVDRQTTAGGWRVIWTRLTPQDDGGLLASGHPAIDVQHAVTIQHRRVLRAFEVSAGLTGIYELNRHLRGDAGSAQAALRLRWLDR